jgi:predicted 3-demethylubiquinone-9 3-methyltransferase (glyoxalase superfamily)
VWNFIKEERERGNLETFNFNLTIMPSSIYPCLWFDHQAAEAASFYLSIFPNSEIRDQNELVVSFQLNGTRMIGLNGGPKYSQTPATSYFVYCGEEINIDQLYSALSFGGKVVIPLDKYDWSPRYAWVQDKFGTNWQLDGEPIRSAQKIVPCLLFVNEKRDRVKEALQFYTGIFSNSTSLMEAAYPNTETLLFAQYKLSGFVVNSMSSPRPHEYDFSPGNSLVIECKDQEEIDYFWEKLGEKGRFDQCGWLADQFGVSWQIIPQNLGKLISDPINGKKASQNIMKMSKLIIDQLENP